MTLELFREDGYLRSCDATVVSIDGDAVVLDRTVFYPTGGGQPGDTGHLTLANGSRIEIVDTRKGDGGICHVAAEGSLLPAAGDRVHAEIDWARRHRLMRMHTCMHLLCSIVPLGVTGGSIRDGSARLDFDAPDPLDKDDVSARLNQVIGAGLDVRSRWVSEAELDDRPDLVRTMSVQPPRGAGRVRLVEVDGVDLQPCGGTHVKNTAEIGRVRVSKIEKKGKHNRRINVVFEDGPATP